MDLKSALAGFKLTNVPMPNVHRSFLSDDLKEASLAHKLKSDEEVKRFTVKEDLGDLERAEMFLTSKYFEQRMSVCTALPLLLREHKHEAVQRVFPLLTTVLGKGERELQLDARRVFNKLIANKMLSDDDMVEYCVPLLQRMMSVRKADNHQHQVCDMWLRTTHLALQTYSTPKLSDALVDFAVQKSAITEPDLSRTMAGALLKYIVVHGKDETQQRALKANLLLCQDTSIDIRAGMCEHLPALAHAVGEHRTEQTIVPELNALLEDEESEVQIAAVQALIRILDLVSNQVRTKQAIPLLQRLYNQPSDDVLIPLAKLFGEMVYNLKDHIMGNEDLRKLFLNFYKRLRDSPNSALRHHCAYNLPAAVMVFGRDEYVTRFHSVLSKLAADDHVGVKRVIAASLHEIAKLVGPELTLSYIHPQFLKLLNDCAASASEELSGALLPHLLELLQVYAAHPDGDDKTKALVEVLHALVAFEGAPLLKLKWRLKEQLFQLALSFPQFFPKAELYETFVEPLLERMKSGVRPLQLAATRVLVEILRLHPVATQRAELAQRLIRQFAHSRSSFGRVRFVSICTVLQDAFSRAWIKTNVFDSLIALAQDPVVAVRCKLCAMLPTLKKALKLPEDQERVDAMNKAVARLMTDPSRAVNRAVTKAVAQMSKFKVRDAGAVSSYLDDDEEEDMKKEQLEKQLGTLMLDDTGGRGGRRSSVEETRRRIENLVTARKRTGSVRTSIQANSLRLGRGSRMTKDSVGTGKTTLRAPTTLGSLTVPRPPSPRRPGGHASSSSGARPRSPRLLHALSPRANRYGRSKSANSSPVHALDKRRTTASKGAFGGPSSSSSSSAAATSSSSTSRTRGKFVPPQLRRQRSRSLDRQFDRRSSLPGGTGSVGGSSGGASAARSSGRFLPSLVRKGGSSKTKASSQGLGGMKVSKGTAKGKGKSKGAARSLGGAARPPRRTVHSLKPLKSSGFGRTKR